MWLRDRGDIALPPSLDSTNESRPPIIGFTPNWWSHHWSSRQQILRGLATRGWPTVYSSGALTVWDVGTPEWQASPWLHDHEVEGELRIDRPGRLIARWPNRRFYDRIAFSAHARHLNNISCGGAGGGPVVMLFHPMFWPYVRQLRPRHVIYYAYDAHCLTPGWNDDLARFEEDLIARADLIITFTQGMLDQMPGVAATSGRVLPTGVDTKLFEAALDKPPPPDLEQIPRPRIGYAGRINQKLDYPLVREIAERRPEWHWVFIGTVGRHYDGRFAADAEAESHWLRCRDLPNVHVLGSKPHDEVPLYLQHIDANVMCYRTSAGGWWSEIFPLKMLEYLSIGRPVVSTPVTSVLPFAANVAIASTPGQWIDAIEHALAGDGVGTVESRRSVALANTWDQRLDCLDRWMRDMLVSESRDRTRPAEPPSTANMPARPEKQLV